MNSPILRPTFALAFALGTSAITAQPILVSPSGIGDYTDLQTAIDSVAPFTTIRVAGGTWEPVVITKSLTLIGAPRPPVRARSDMGSGTFGGGPQPSAIRLQGTGTESVVISNFRIGDGGVDGFVLPDAEAALGGSGFARVEIHDSFIRGSDWFFLTGEAEGFPASN